MATEKHILSLRLTKDVHKRLIALSQHLGTNPNSYMVNVIGRAISQDELTFKSQSNQADLFEQVAAFIAQSQPEVEPKSDDND